MSKKLIIVGAGFGGLTTMRYLKKIIKNGDLEVTLYNPHNYFMFSAMLHEVASGGLEPELILESIKETIGDLPVKFIDSKVDKIDLTEKVVYSGEIEDKYDYLVLASGSKTNDYGIEGVSENTLGLKSIDDAIAIKNRIIDEFDEVNKGGEADLNFVVVGGGPTGVELTADLSELIYGDLMKFYKEVDPSKVSLNLFTDDGLVKYFSDKSRKSIEKYLDKLKINVHTKTKISKITKEGIETNNGLFKSTNVIWVAGVKATYPELLGNYEVDHCDRLIVNDLLQLERHSSAFVIGDSASGHPMLAYTSTRQAKNIAGNITKLITYAKDENFDNRDAKLKTFSFKPVVKLLSLGQKGAVGEFFGINVKGGLIWYMWRGVYLLKVHTFRKQVQIAVQWFFNFFSPRDITRI